MLVACLAIQAERLRHNCLVLRFEKVERSQVCLAGAEKLLDHVVDNEHVACEVSEVDEPLETGVGPPAGEYGGEILGFEARGDVGADCGPGGDASVDHLSALKAGTEVGRVKEERVESSLLDEAVDDWLEFLFVRVFGEGPSGVQRAEIGEMDALAHETGDDFLATGIPEDTVHDDELVV